MGNANKFLYIATIVIGIFILVGILLVHIFGLTFNDLPMPTGQYSVGNTLLHWKNKAENIDHKYQEFNVDVFYPIKKAQSAEKYAYQPTKIKALIKAISEDSLLPEFIWNRLLSNIHTYTKSNEPIDQSSKFPVIIYLPGMHSEDLHNIYLEELASHGYVLFAIEPPYDILATVFPDNRVITADPQLKEAVRKNNRPEIYNYRNAAHIRWNQYLESTIKNIKDLNNDQTSQFYQRLDVDHIGLLGHSHGGAVIVDFCQKNNSCLAGVDMDGWTKTYNTGAVFKVPFLFMLSEMGEMAEMRELFTYNAKNTNFKKLIIKGAGHNSFNDQILARKPFSFMNQSNEQVRADIAKNLLFFFDRNLKS